MGGNKSLQRVATTIWIALVVALSLIGSLAFACAAPFAAIAALAGAKMRVSSGVALVLSAWITNQAVGYLVLDYPRTWDSFAWGGAIGVASVAGFAMAAVVARGVLPDTAKLIACFLAAFATFEASLLAATTILPSSAEAFSLSSIGRIFLINAIALGALMLLHRGAIALNLLTPLRTAQPTPA